jgi:phosphatidylserine/phosphatidylglycerophosphate/cardiolipin synthase-like enzyme
MAGRRKLSLGGRSHIDVYYPKGHTNQKLPPTLDPLPGLLRVLDKARHEIVFGIFSLTAPPIADAIVAKHKAGKSVRGVSDAREATSPTSKTRLMHAAGVDIAFVGTPWALMHLKVAVVDGLHVAYGSYNWTTQAETRNDEILTVVSNRQLAAVCITQIDAIRKAAK